MTTPFPPIRPSRLARFANRLGLRRSELLAALAGTAAGVPIAIAAWLIITTPGPQPPPTPFAPSIATSSAAEPSVGVETARAPAPARTAPVVVPRVRVAKSATKAPAATRAPDTRTCPELGRVNIPRADPDYRPALDRDGNGVACQAPTGAPTSPAAEPSTQAPTKPPVTTGPAPTTAAPTVP